VDDTARPQTVTAEDNPDAYALIKSYEEITGLPILINTSFNMHEEPIVCSPNDAIRAFLLGRLDALAIGSFIAIHPTGFDPGRRG
jgi:carbamoyltransferase